MELIIVYDRVTFEYPGRYFTDYTNGRYHPFVRLDDGTEIHLYEYSVKEFECILDEYGLNALPLVDTDKEIEFIITDN